MFKTIPECTDIELQAIVTSTKATGRFAAERDLAIREMGRRVARKFIAREQRRLDQLIPFAID